MLKLFCLRCSLLSRVFHKHIAKHYFSVGAALAEIFNDQKTMRLCLQKIRENLTAVETWWGGDGKGEGEEFSASMRMF